MTATSPRNAIAVVGIDIGKNSFHIVALDDRGAIISRRKWSRGQLEARLASAVPHGSVCWCTSSQSQERN
jgi:Tfp pilus assembly PilM family ATPase